MQTELENKVDSVTANLDALAADFRTLPENTEVGEECVQRMRTAWTNLNGLFVESEEVTPFRLEDYRAEELSLADNRKLQGLLRAFGRTAPSAIEIREQLHCSRDTSERLAKLFPEYSKALEAEKLRVEGKK